MARMHKTVELEGGKSVTVHELTVKQIMSIINDDALGEQKDMSVKSMQSFAERHLGEATDLKVEDMIEMAPSELKTVYDAFAEVNETFFATARAVGLDKMLSELKQAIAEDFSKLLVDSLKQVT